MSETKFCRKPRVEENEESAVFYQAVGEWPVDDADKCHHSLFRWARQRDIGLSVFRVLCIPGPVLCIPGPEEIIKKSLAGNESPSTDYLPAGGASWQTKAVMIFLFAFLVGLLAALCYALFNCLTAASEPSTRAPGVITNGVDTGGTETSSEDRPTPAVPTPRPPSVRPIRTSSGDVTVTRSTTPERPRPTQRPPDEPSSTPDLTTDSTEPIYTTPEIDTPTSAPAPTPPSTVNPWHTTRSTTRSTTSRSTDVPVTSGHSIEPTGSTTPA
ncbi:hypothetical protein MTO96_022570, partial [Rhipicephalus appendiculatus]